MTRLTIALFSVLLISPSLCLWGQNDQNSFSLAGNLAMPAGDFGDYHNYWNGDGYAKLGFGITGEYNLGLGAKGLFWSTSLTFLYNPVAKDFKNQIEALYSIDGVDVGVWINVPLMTGLQYRHHFSQAVGIFGSAQLGVNFVKAPDYTYNESAASLEGVSDVATSLGFCISAGVVVSNTILISVKYLDLDKPEFEAEEELRSAGKIVASREFEIDTKVSLILFSVGLLL